MMKELDQLNQEIEELGRSACPPIVDAVDDFQIMLWVFTHREKVSLDDELQKREEAVRQKSAEVKVCFLWSI